MFKVPDKNNVMRGEELGTWLKFNAPSPPPPLTPQYLNLDHDHVTSLTSEYSSPFSLFSNGFRLHGDAFRTLNRSHYSESSSYKVHHVTDHNDDVGLSQFFSGISILDEQGKGSVVDAKTRGYDHIMDSSYTHTPCSLDARISIPCFSEEMGTDVKWGLPSGSVVESSLNNYGRRQGNTACYGQVQLQKPSSFATTPYPFDQFVPFGMDCNAGWDVKSPFEFSQTMQPNLGLDLNSPSHGLAPPTRERVWSNTGSELSLCLSSMRNEGDPVAFKCDNSFIIQGKDEEYCVDDGCKCNSLWGSKRSSQNEVGIQVVGEKVPQVVTHVPSGNENNCILASDVPQNLLLNFYSLSEVQGCIYQMAKDQNGCRFLQKMVDEGTSEHLRVVFKGVVDHVVELMMDPFGNYLVQKLLDVCREDQRLQVVLMLTKEPGQLVKTSLNTHGTRVVQKLIETLNSRKQISLVRSAIQPGFLDLIKDLNGNHVIQRCLQCLSYQENEFIFDAAAKFCVEVATHRHGCCVLQRCIDYSMGKYQDKLVTEICRHGLLLAQDPFGNYVVQYIIEMENPSALTKLISQFKGHYVKLSMQKFSSHVVEKCLKHAGESRSRIVKELLSAPHFEQLLQDPYANYVVQCALTVTKGSLHASLVEAVRPHKILRTSPYCKRIFTGNLLKK